MTELSEVFLDAASALEDPASPAARRHEVVELLDWLGCPRPDAPDAPALHRARLLRAAAGFRRLFGLAAEAAPGFSCFGAEIDPVAVAALPGLPVAGVAGGGVAPLEAFERCVGEGIERLSAMENADDLGAIRPPPVVMPNWLADHPALAAAPDWLPARCLTGGSAAVLLPAELCRWRPPSRRRVVPPFATSLGCAAGPTVMAAMLAGLCEVVERDAAALWWRGGRRGRPLPLEAAVEAAAHLERFRQSATRARRSWLLDLTTDLGIPAVAAISCAPSGGGVCIGIASRPRLDRAAVAAVRDLVLNELAVELVETKRAARGEAALNEADNGHLQRSTGLHVARHTILHPLGAPDADAASTTVPASTPELTWVLDRLVAAGHEVFAVDLTRPVLGVPAVRLLCPGLEGMPSEMVGSRLGAAQKAASEDCTHAGIALM